MESFWRLRMTLPDTFREFFDDGKPNVANLMLFHQINENLGRVLKRFLNGREFDHMTRE